MTKPINKEQTALEGMPEPEQRLTPKQLRFTIAYLTHFNGARAAREAGYSERTANHMAYENLTKPHIIRYIKRRLDSYALSVDEITAKLGAMARGEIPTKTVHRQDGDTIRVERFYDERLALEDVAKVHGMFVDRHSIERIDGIEVVDDVTIIEQDPLQLSDNGADE